MLESPFTEEEVLSALGEFSGDKALGPNGFSMAFLQSSWDFIMVEVMVFFGQFFDHDQFVRSINAMSVVLVSKKGGVENFKDFRLINLVGGL